jgi:hypothetical protein
MLEHMYQWDGNIRILEIMSYVIWNGLALPIMLHNAPSEPVAGELANVVNIMGSARPFHDIMFWDGRFNNLKEIHVQQTCFGHHSKCNMMIIG